MPLLPRASSRRFASGGQLGYESQLGSGTTSTGGTAGKVGDALYQNLPPLAVPFIHVQREDLDGVRADIQQQLSLKSEKLKSDLSKMRDKALEGAHMTAAGKAQVARNYDKFLGKTMEAFSQNPALLNSPAASTQILQDYSRAVDAAFITSNVNGMKASDKLHTDIGKDRLDYGAYDQNNRRLNRSNSQVIQDYQENVNAGTGPLNLTVRNGTEQDAYAALDKLITLPTSTSGGEHAGVSVGQISGGQGDRYTMATSNSSVTTTNAPRMQELAAAMIGYTDKKGKYHEGDWKKGFAENEIYGLEEPRLAKYDRQALQPGEKVTIDLSDGHGQTQPVAVVGGQGDNPLAGRTRREILQYLEANPTKNNQLALAQLEQNRTHLADRDVKNLLALRLGLKRIDGTVRKENISASRIAPTTDPAAKDAGTSVFAAAGGQSPAFPTAALTTYPVIGQDGTVQTVNKTDAQGKTSQVPISLTPAVSLLSGVEGVGDWMDRAIKQTGYTTGKDGSQAPMLRPKSMEQFSNQEPIYHMIPNVGLRQVQGGALGKMPQASKVRLISHDGTLTWMDANPVNGIVGREQTIQRVTEANATLEKKRNANQISQPQFDQAMNKLKIEARANGVLPYMRVVAVASENTLKDITQPDNSKNQDSHISRFGYLDPKTKKAVRPDQFIFGARNDMEGLSKLGWEEMSDSEAENAGVGDLNGKMNNGLFGTMFKTTMYVPATNITFNSSAKSVNQNVSNVEAEKRQQAKDDAVSSGEGGQWHP